MRICHSEDGENAEIIIVNNKNFSFRDLVFHIFIIYMTKDFFAVFVLHILTVMKIINFLERIWNNLHAYLTTGR